MQIGRSGGHRTDRHGVGIESRHETKLYEFGDHFNLDLQQSVMNAVRRNERVLLCACNKTILKCIRWKI
jgi:uncharacterized protein with von Willebrand factor type A (vWA) domain